MTKDRSALLAAPYLEYLASTHTFGYPIHFCALSRKTALEPSGMVLAEGAPAFVRFDGPLYSGGPTWRIEVATPAA
jgi:hypothetical protein